MKKRGQILATGMAAVMACSLVFGAVGCGKNDGGGENNDPVVTVVIGDAADRIAEGETVQLSATVGNTENTAVEWTTSDPTVLRVDATGKVSVVEAKIFDTTVTITAKSKADERVVAHKVFTVSAKKQDGKNGMLTAEMMNAIGDKSITVKGTVSDIYRDVKNSANSYTSNYSMEVKMEEGKWSGAWGAGETMTVSDTYEEGTNTVKDQNGVVGKEMLQVYINKNNEVTRQPVKNYVSIPSVWGEQHLWNHLSNIPLDKMTQATGSTEEESGYIYTADEADADSLYLMTYLSFSLTPMMDETLQTVRINVKKNEQGVQEITSIAGQTYTQYVNPVQSQSGAIVGYDAISYTQLVLTLSDVGTTTVEDPKPYEAPEHVDKLQAALNKMKTADNYTFRAVDTTTSAPSTDEGDYELQAVSSKAASLAATRAVTDEPKYNGIVDVITGDTTDCKSYSSKYNHTANSGTVGVNGTITNGEILLERVTQYSGSLDGNNFRFEYTGYKQMTTGDGAYYERFAFDHNAVSVPQSEGAAKKYGAMMGVQSVRGQTSELLPTFDFSPNLFKCTGANEMGNGRYTFTLQATNATRELALETSMHPYSIDATASSSRAFTIVVDGNGNLLSVTYPYSLTQGTYLGYITTTFSEIGTTEMPKDVFVQYQARGWKTSWADYSIMHYDDVDGNRINDMNAETGAKSIYGSNYSSLPTPEQLMTVWGDDLNGPFYNTRTRTGANGETKTVRYMDITTDNCEYDENMQITNFKEIVEKMDNLLIKQLGFTKNQALTDTSGGESGRGTRYVVYDNGKITVVMENNFTKNFWISFYNHGEYTRGNVTA